MRGSIQLGRVAGIPISVHWSFSLLVLFVVLSGLGSSPSKVLLLVLWVVALFACVTVHELSHCFVAVRRGLSVRGVTLLPIGGVSNISGLPASPAVEAAVAIAGPLSSLVLAGVLGLAGFATGAHIWPPTLFAGSWLARLAWLNLLLAGFNMLPALPMDGGRVLRAMLARHGDEAQATRVAASVAQGLAAVMILVGLLVDLWLVFIGLFVLLGAAAEGRLGRLQEALGGLRVGDVMVPETTAVPSELTVAEFGQWCARYPGRALPVEEGGDTVGIVSMVDLVGKPWNARIGTVCDRQAPLLDPSTPLFPDAFGLLVESRRSELAVAEHGRPVGVLYGATVEGLAQRSRAGFATPQPDSGRAAA